MEYGDYILDYVERSTNVRLKDRLAVRQIFSVSDFASRYNAPRGTALGLATAAVVALARGAIEPFLQAAPATAA